MAIDVQELIFFIINYLCIDYENQSIRITVSLHNNHNKSVCIIDYDNQSIRITASLNNENTSVLFITSNYVTIQFAAPQYLLVVHTSFP